METKSLEIQSKKHGASQALNPKNIEEAMKLAEYLSKSSIVPKELQGNPGNILVAIGMGQEVGLGPLQAIQNIMVVNGKPSCWGDAVLGLVRASGLLESIKEVLVGELATCTVKRVNEEAIVREFSLDDAKRAGLNSKPGPWQTYPKRMLQMRARAWALRDGFADVLKGLQVREEVEDYEPIRDVTPAKPEVAMPKLKQPESPALPEPVKATENPGKVLEAVVADEAENAATLPLWNVAVTPVKNSNGGKAWKIHLETGVQLLTKDEKLKKMIEDGRAAGATAKLSWQGEPKVLVDVVPA